MSSKLAQKFKIVRNPRQLNISYYVWSLVQTMDGQSVTYPTFAFFALVIVTGSRYFWQGFSAEKVMLCFISQML